MSLLQPPATQRHLCSQLRYLSQPDQRELRGVCRNGQVPRVCRARLVPGRSECDGDGGKTFATAARSRLLRAARPRPAHAFRGERRKPFCARSRQTMKSASRMMAPDIFDVP